LREHATWIKGKAVRASPRSRALGVTLALALAGCGLFVGAPKRALCAFEGDETACGTCLREECLEALGDCCGAEGCRAGLASVATCTGSATCAADLEAAGGASLARCLERSCAEACAAPGAGSGGDGGDPDASSPGDGPGDGGPDQDLDAGGDAATDAAATADGGPLQCRKLGGYACTCDAPHPDKLTGVACDESVGPSAVCCADTAWPSAGTCSCMTASCNRPAGGGCSCSLGVDGDSCNDGTVCCVSPQGQCLCTYGATTCFRGYRTVAACTGEAIGCGVGKKKVPSCQVTP
jgi:hypothetical protein